MDSDAPTNRSSSGAGTGGGGDLDDTGSKPSPPAGGEDIRLRPSCGCKERGVAALAARACSAIGCCLTSMYGRFSTVPRQSDLLELQNNSLSQYIIYADAPVAACLSLETTYVSSISCLSRQPDSLKARLSCCRGSGRPLPCEVPSSCSGGRQSEQRPTGRAGSTARS